MENYRVLVIQDNRLLRDEMVARLRKYKNLKVTGAEGISLLASSCRMKPDVILLSPDLQIVRQIKLLYPASRLVVTDVDAVQSDMRTLVGAGVCGFVARNATSATLVNAVKSIVCRKPVIPLELMERLAAQINELDTSEAQTVAVVGDSLTRRQAEIVELIAQGMSNQEIANHFKVSIFTVKSHVHSILEKLSLKSRLQISAYTRSHVTRRPAGAHSEENWKSDVKRDVMPTAELNRGLPELQVA